MSILIENFAVLASIVIITELAVQLCCSIAILNTWSFDNYRMYREGRGPARGANLDEPLIPLNPRLRLHPHNRFQSFVGLHMSLSSYSSRYFQRNLGSFTAAKRTMSSATTPAKFEWLVIVPDHENALATRMQVRP